MDLFVKLCSVFYLLELKRLHSWYDEFHFMTLYSHKSVMYMAQELIVGLLISCLSLSPSLFGLGHLMLHVVLQKPTKYLFRNI